MRILIITVFFPPLNSIASHRPYSWAKYWTLAGHEVTVATTPKVASADCNLNLTNPGFQLIEIPTLNFISRMQANYHQKTTPNKTSFSFKALIKKGLTKIYHYLRYQKGIFNASRLPDFTDLWIRPALRVLEKEKPWDLIVTTAGPYAVHIIGSQLKKKGLTKKWVADFRDLWADNHIYPGLFPFNQLEGWLEKKTLKRADLLTVVTEPWAEKLRARHTNLPVKVIENGFEPADLELLPKESIFSADSKLRIVHTGMVYREKQALPLFFEAIQQLKQQAQTAQLVNKLEVLFVGPHLAFVKELSLLYGIEELVKELGFVKREQALAMQRDAALLLFLPWSEAKGTGTGLMSGKIYEYLYAQTPVLAISQQTKQVAQEWIKEQQIGVVCHTVKEVKEYLETFLKQEASQKNRINPLTLEKFSRKTLALKLLSYLT